MQLCLSSCYICRKGRECRSGTDESVWAGRGLHYLYGGGCQSECPARTLLSLSTPTSF